MIAGKETLVVCMFHHFQCQAIALGQCLAHVYRIHFSVRVFCGLATIREGFICKTVDTNVYAQYNGQPNSDVAH